MKKLLSILLLATLFFSAPQMQAQPGCTDPQANNFDPLATENDGSCLYPPTSYQPQLVAELPADLTECSGLAFFDDQLWTHLDGGNLDRLYTLDTLTAQKLSTVTVTNADNLDWEDLAEDSEHLYVGDFGNNSGNRTDLRIYKIKKTDLLAGTISPEVIAFSWSDQTDFTPAPNANNFDCEAFFFWQDSLHLFSKNWTDFKTRHYVLPTAPGTHVAMLRDSLNVQGQVTAADITEDGTVLLLGYNVSTLQAFLWLLFDFDGDHVFSGNKRKISLGSVGGVSQPEGLAFRDSTRGYICSEDLSIFPQKLLAFDIGPYLENPVNGVGELSEHNSGVLKIFPNPASEVLHIQLENLAAYTDFTLSVTDVSGRLVLEECFPKNLNINELSVNIAHLRSGNYWVRIEGEGTRAAAQFSKN